MRSGQLFHTIDIIKFIGHSVDEYGVATPSWSMVESVRAELIQQTATEFLASKGADETITRVFKTRFLRNVSNADQIKFEGINFNIKEIVVIGRNRGMELRAEEIRQ